MITATELDGLVARIRDRANPEHIVLFGSHAKGTATDRSDVDLLVVVDSVQPTALRTSSLRPLYATMTVPVDVHVHTPQEVREYGSQPYHFLNTVLLTGRVLYSDPRAPGLPQVGRDRGVRSA